MSLTRQAGFARLKDAADPANYAGFMLRAEVAELADARGSGPRTRKGVGVRVPSSAPSPQNKPLREACYYLLLLLGFRLKPLETAGNH